ncbi:MAG: FlgD immunoglobulin-like domain containing protein [bacterium]|nr:FlgD immunoglobulin-like domain containing protein [bacterium]
MKKVLPFLFAAALLALTNAASPNFALAADLSVTINTVDQNGRHIPGYVQIYGQGWQASPYTITLPEGATSYCTAFAGFRTVEQVVTISDNTIVTIDATDTSVTQTSGSGAGSGLAQVSFQFLPLSVTTDTVNGTGQHIEGWARTAYYASWYATPYTYTPQDNHPDLIVNGGTVSFEAMALSTTITRTVPVWQDTDYTVGDETTTAPGPGPGAATIDFVFTVLTVYLDTVDRNGQHIDGFIQRYGQDWQATPTTVTMPEGASTIFTAFSGYRTVEQTVTIQEGTIYPIDATGASVSMTTAGGAVPGTAQVTFMFLPLSVACDTFNDAGQHADGFIRPASHATWQTTPYTYTPQHSHPELIVNGGVVPFEASAFATMVTQTITVWEDTAYTVNNGVTEGPGAGAGAAKIDFIFSTLTLTIDTINQDGQHIDGFVKIYGQDWQASPFTLTIAAGVSSIFSASCGYRTEEQVITAVTENNIYIVDATDTPVTQSVQSGAGTGAAQVVFKFLPLSVTCDTLDGSFQHIENGEVWIDAFDIYHFAPYTYQPTDLWPELIVNGGTVTFEVFASFKTILPTVTIWQNTAYTVNGEMTSAPGPGPEAATIDFIFHFLSVTFDTVDQNGQHIKGMVQLADQGWQSTPYLMELPDGILNRFIGFAGYRVEETILTISDNMIYTIDATDSPVIKTNAPGAGSGAARVVFEFYPLTLTCDTVNQAGGHVDGFVRLHPALPWQNSPYTYSSQDGLVVNGATTYSDAYSEYASGGMGLILWNETIYTVDLTEVEPTLTTEPGLGVGLAALNFIVAEQAEDLTPPVVAIGSPEARPYLHPDTVSISFSATDPESGVDTVTAILDGEKEFSNGNILELFRLSLGEHTLVVTAWNGAGASASASVTFEIVATIDTLIKATDVAYEQGLIDSRKVWLSLRAKAVLARTLIEYHYYNLAKICLWAYIKEAESYKGTHITPWAANYLKAEAGYVIRHLPDNQTAAINVMIFAVKIGYDVGLISNQFLADSLIAKLDRAKFQIAGGYLDAAKETMQKFINQVRNANAKDIHPDLANLLIQSARYIIDHLDPSQAAPILAVLPDFLNSETLIQAVPEITKTRLGQNYPNPLNPETWIPFELAGEANVSIRIYNLSGNLVRTMELGKLGAGSYTSKGESVYWDGKDNNGNEVASGVYLYQFIAGSHVEIKKMIVLK